MGLKGHAYRIRKGTWEGWKVGFHVVATHLLFLANLSICVPFFLLRRFVSAVLYDTIFLTPSIDYD
jgi:hypothetical protein